MAPEKKETPADASGPTKTGPQEISTAEKLRRLNNEETVSEPEASRDQTDTCLENDKIKKIEIIAYTEIIKEELDINTTYGAHKEFMAKVRSVGEKATPQGAPPPSEDFSLDGKALTIFKRFVYSGVQEPSFIIGISSRNTNQSIKTEHDENKDLLFSGPHQKKIFGGNGSANISDLTTLRISQQKAHILVTNLTENAFTQSPGKPQLDIRETSRRLVEKIAIRINGEEIYSRDDVQHVFALTKDTSLTSNSTGLIWEDPDFRQNKAFSDYLERFENCKNSP